MSKNTAEKQYITNIAMLCAVSLLISVDQFPSSLATMIFIIIIVVFMLAMAIYNIVIMPPIWGGKYNRARQKAAMRATQRAHAPDMQLGYFLTIIMLLMLNAISNRVDLSAKQAIAIALSFATTTTLLSALVRSFQMSRKRTLLDGHIKEDRREFLYEK